MVSFIVGNMHVGTSDTGIVREFYRRFRAARLKGRVATKDQRKETYRAALEYHHENQDIVRQFHL